PLDHDSIGDTRPSYDPLKIAQMVESDPDYRTLSLSANLPFLPTVGFGISATIDRFGKVYVGISGEVSVGTLLPTFATVEGKLLLDGKGEPVVAPIKEQLKAFLCGDSVNAHGQMVVGPGITNSSGGTATEVVVASSVGAGAGFAHNF